MEVKLPREIWILIFEYKQAHFEKAIRQYVNVNLMFFPRLRLPPNIPLDDLYQIRVRKRGEYVLLTIGDLLIDRCRIE